ncbi:histidinol-phosphate transaminase [Litoribrevibacter albus]|uniref:Histidinol-phosphate aminotransferase n=1 Tax=Litoribrevibacter albus TaxID=1473156 RepID=A0AA37W542_9GAMM|nr:histidinol-phosphate transaminase [Litoribrevibacter albus]GLQ30762.1 histidinol-phosphate aminotransferase 2 [Litoribrevibacter albus]
MGSNIDKLVQNAVPGVAKLHPYQPGKPVDELARELGLNPDDIVKLASNENPLGPSKRVLAAIEAELPELTRYPDGNGFELKQALSSRFDLKPNQITLGNGSNDVLDLIARAFLQPGTNAVFSQYAFAVYPISTQAVGADLNMVPAKDYGHDLSAMAKAINSQTRVVFLANPNNPTGTMFGRDEFRTFMTEVPGDVLVVLDEAYSEYVSDENYPDGIELLTDYSNLVVTRTFSKAYGLASLRVGWAASAPEIADLLNRVRQPFNVDSLALAAAKAALADVDYLEAGKKLNDQGLIQITEALDAKGLSYIPTKGNFIAVDFAQDTAAINQAFLEKGVILRPIANYGLPNHLRVSIGTQEENQRFITVLNELDLNGES